MKLKILSKEEKEEFLKRVSYLGDLKSEGIFIKTGERIRLFTGSLTEKEILKIWNLYMIEGIGLYIAKDFFDRKTKSFETRLSLDGLHFFKNQISDSIIEIDEEQKEKWFRGESLILKEEQIKKVKSEIIALVFKGDFVGSGKIKGDRVYNYLPKERRVKVSF
ncbi:MAG: hypothetical protein QW273_03135 [Candidatus Pacearchaeota archaeon]